MKAVQSMCRNLKLKSTITRIKTETPHLYDEVAMPSELRRAHQQNDRAVMQAYGFDIKTTTESTCVAELMRRYQARTARP